MKILIIAALLLALCSCEHVKKGVDNINNTISSIKQDIEDRDLIELDETNSVLLEGPINHFSITQLIGKLILLRSLNPDIPLYISIISNGGSVSDYTRAYEFLKGQKNIHTIAIVAQSAAAFLMQTNYGNRYVLENSMIMFHRTSADLPMLSLNGEIQDTIKNIEKSDRIYESVIADRLKLNLEEYYEKVKKDWMIIGGAEIIKNNAADKLIRIRCTTKAVVANVCPFIFNPQGVQDANQSN